MAGRRPPHQVVSTLLFVTGTLPHVRSTLHLAGTALHRPQHTAAQRAAKDVPGLAQKFVLAPQPTSYLSFRSLARTVAAEAEERKEILVKHGLVDSVLVSLAESLSQLDQAVARGAEGRRIHVAATIELHVVSGEAVQIVRVLDGHNRVRFAGDPDLLAAWKSASNVVGPSRSAQKPDEPEAPASDGAVKPAA